MAAKKVKLKEPEIKDTSSFASLMAQFGAKPEGVDPQGTRVDSQGTRVDPEGTHTPKTVPSQGTHTPQGVDSQGTHTPKTVPSQGTRVDPEGTRVDSQGTHKGVGVDSQGTQRGVSVDPEGTHKGVSVDSQGTRVPLEGTPIDPKTSPSAFWYSQKIDFYSIGFWNVLFDVIGAGGQTVSIRPLAKRFGLEKSHFHRLLKRLEAAGMLRLISQKEGSFIQLIEPVSPLSLHEEEEVFKKQLQLPYGKDFQKMIVLRDALESIFWGCLAVGRNVDELSGTTVNYLVELSGRRSPDYVAGVLVKYIKEARHPLTFLQTVFQKEPDPLSQIEIDRGQQTLKAGEELLRNINRLDEYGLNGMRELVKPLTGLDLGKTIEAARAALESLREKRGAFMEKWGVS